MDKNLQLSPLIRDFSRWRNWDGIDFDEAIITGPRYAKITSGFGEYFGPGKSPFKPAMMIILDYTLHVLVDNFSFKHSKWHAKLQDWTKVYTVLFYSDKSKGDHDLWMKVFESFNEVMSHPVWKA